MTAMHPFTLRFEDASAEAAFERDHRRAALGYYRMLALAVLGLFVILSVVGLVVEFSVNRAGVQRLLWFALIPLTAAATAALWWPRFSPHGRAIVLAYLAGLAIVCIAFPIASADRLIAESYGFSYSAFLLFGALAFCRLSPPGALGFAIAVIAAYAGAIGAAVSPVAATNHVPLLVGAAALGFAVGYVAERSVRQLYAAHRVIEDRERKLAQSQAQLLEAQHRSEELILSLLPAPVAARLKAEPGATIADGITECTVLFTDLVGFTPFSRERGPRALVKLLNRLFSEFDAICERHGIERIKTIGDAYMAAAGASGYLEDHASRAADTALDMRESLRRLNEAEGCSLRLRVGLHSGPVIAGVIGLRRFAFDLWGETVNVASRMESHGEPDRVQLSEATALLVKRTHDVEERGAIEIKGQGAMRTFWLVARRSDALR